MICYLKIIIIKVIILNVFVAGFRAGVLDHGAVDVQRPDGPARPDPEGEGHGRGERKVDL